MKNYDDLLNFLQNIGKDPSRLIFEDELTGIYNRRFLLNYLQYKVAWDGLQNRPLSLIMMDIDFFKRINDTYGHQVGDQVLIWTASLLKEAAGDDCLAIRYSGDEFMIFIPHGEKRVAMEMGERLLKKTHEQTFPIKEENIQEKDLRITFSIGIASAPEDAQTGKSLIQKADVALYYSKKEGRDRLANAGEINPQEVFAKTALHNLEEEKITGRRKQLAQVSEFLKRFTQGQNCFLIIEGSAGMGKSLFLETLHRNLAQNKMIRQAKVNGTPQEMFRPYYLMTKILVELLNQKSDKGVGALEGLNPNEIAYLSHLLPQLPGPAGVLPEEDEKKTREGLFNTLLHFFPKIIESNSLVLLIDDLHFADEASLFMLRQLILQKQFPFFLCGTSMNFKQFKLEGEGTPLEGFFQAYHQEIEIHTIGLTPLTVSDIAEHLQGVFPQVIVPENFEKNLEEITQGNPLFLSEILLQLVLDQKITLTGQQWVIQPLQRDDLPRSLEAIVIQKIAALDEESRQLLHQASILGEDLSLSFLAGSSKKEEGRILQFVDQAVTQGLIKTNFEVNDQTLHFVGKRILDITESSIQMEEKRKLHEQVGNYQEVLYQKRLLPSTAPLAYHFRHSPNLEKAKLYQQFDAAYQAKVFNPAEAVHYSGERRSELPPPGSPLDSASLAQVPMVMRCLLTALRNSKLYPLGSEPIASANRQVKEALDPILENNENLTIFQVRQALMINGKRMDVSEYKWVAEELLKVLGRVELKGIIFHQGLTDQEMDVLVEALGRIQPKMIDREYWHRFSADHQMLHIELKQVRYTIRVETDSQISSKKISFGAGQDDPRRVPYQLLARDNKLEGEELIQIPEILRALLNASKNIRLYPLSSKTISNSIEQLLEALRKVLSKKSVLTLAFVSHSLLVNGVKIDTSGIETLTETFQKFLDSIQLSSITFLETLSIQELQSFIGALGQQSAVGLDREFWNRLAGERDFPGILFDQVQYETRVTPALGFAEDNPDLEETTAIEPIAEELFDTFLKAMPARVRDLLMEEDENKLLRMLRQLFQGFQNRAFLARDKTIETCRRILEELTLAFQHHFAKILADPLLGAFVQESDVKIVREMTVLLHRMATCIIQFGEYPLASRILLNLRQRQQQLEEAKDPYSQRLVKILDRKLERTIQKLLMDDLISGETSRQHNAALLFSSLGRVSIPPLLEIVKKTEDFKVRQIAANLLEELGTEAAELIKRELVLEASPAERSHILEIMHIVTQDLKTELAYSLEDNNPAVRQAAFHLAEQLNTPQVGELLADFAKNQETSLAIDSIECLGKLKPAFAAETLISLLKSSKESNRLIACCRALGHIAAPSSIDPLLAILSRKKFFFRRKWSRVRVTAFFALSQIPHPRVEQLLAAFVDDRDQQIREMARTRTPALFPAVHPPSSK